MTQVAKHPVRGFDWMILSICRDLNDNCRWSRERIADWVESIEAQQPTQQEESCAIKS